MFPIEYHIYRQKERANLKFIYAKLIKYQIVNY